MADDARPSPMTILRQRFDLNPAHPCGAGCWAEPALPLKDRCLTCVLRALASDSGAQKEETP